MIARGAVSQRDCFSRILAALLLLLPALAFPVGSVKRRCPGRVRQERSNARRSTCRKAGESLAAGLLSIFAPEDVL